MTTKIIPHNKLSAKDIDERLEERKIELISEFTRVVDSGKFRCEHGHTWESKVHLVLQGYGCTVCNGGVKLSKDIVNERLAGRHISMIGDYINSYTTSLFKCECGNIWDATPKSIMKGCGCPNCTSSGFKSEKRAYGYILIFNEYLKYGITNSPKSRLKTLRKNGEYEVQSLVSFHSGKDARDWENSVKRTIGGNYMTKDKCVDGYTETLPLTKINELVESINKTRG